MTAVRCLLGGRRSGLVAALLVLLAACGPTRPPDSRPVSAGDAAAAPPALKSITIVSAVERPVLHSKLHGGLRGFPRWLWIANAYLTGIDQTETPQPMLAADIPSLERGTWTANADGTMQTTYRIRPTAMWHDGKPIVAHDFVFAWQVYLDPDFPAQERSVEKLISDIDTPDTHTLVIHWKETYVGAASIGAGSLEPMPSHLLEGGYRTNKTSFVDGKHWSSEFVGAGPFRVEQWVPSEQQFVFAAHDGFALGRPQIDRIMVKVIDDDNAMLAAILAGTVDVLFEDLPPSMALLLREQWEAQGKGTVGVTQGAQRYLAFQLRDLPGTQPGMRDSKVRRALGMAIDRDGLAASQPRGFTPAAYYPMSFSDRLYPIVDRTIPKYANDPVAAERLLEEAAYARGSDGVRRSPAGDRLQVQILTSAGQEDEGIAAVIGDNWRRVGADSEIFVVPAARASDRELQATFPGVNMKTRTPRFDSFYWTSDQIPTAANRWIGNNIPGYSSRESDRLAAGILTTLDQTERDRLIVQILQVWAEDAPVVSYLFKPRIIVAASSVHNYDVEVSAAQGAQAWTIYKWTRD